MGETRYKAFISYSHRDERWARWLQAALERYRVPRRLVGRDGAHGTVPDRLRPVFRDREDLSSASDLTGQIKSELAASETLVVICSPAAAASRWVNEEIRYFSSLGRGDRILALVVDGDPQGAAADHCFPAALLDSGGGRREPLAADLRRYADGKRLSLLKIIAGMLGLRLDELRRRDAQRRLRKRLSYGLSAVVLAGVIGWLAWSTATTQHAARVQRANTEELLSFMLGDLKRLDPIAGVERFEIEGEEQARQAAGLGLAHMDSDALLESALAWRETGMEHNWEGRLDEALEQHRNSRAALIELYQREGKKPDIVFELGQAEYYVGEMYVQKGDAERARQHWSYYGALTRRLLNADPRNPKYVMELSYTLTNLGALEQVIPEPDFDKSIELLQAALQYNQMALVLDPDNLEYRQSMASELEWLADGWLNTCALGNALEVRLETVALRRAFVAEQPSDLALKMNLATNLTGLAGVQEQIGLSDKAIGSFEEGMALLREIHEEEPANEDIEWELLYRSARLARHLIALGELEQAAGILFPMAGRIDELGRDESTFDYYRVMESALFDLDYARLQLARGKPGEGELKLHGAIERLVKLVREKPDYGDGLSALALAYFEYWQHFGRTHAEAGLLLGRYDNGDAEISGCWDAARAARVAAANGEWNRARELSAYVIGKGYYEPGFVGFCRRYELCE